MKKTISLALFMFAFWASHANAAFLGAYSANNWQKTNNGGFSNLSGAPDSIRINSNAVNNSGKSGNIDFDFTISSIGKGFVSFDWSYKTNDKNGAQADPFGWLLNGVFTKLTNDNGGKIQSGTFTAFVRVGDIFGFRANTLDSLNGAATSTISNFSAPYFVPVPAAIWLFAAPLLGLMGKRRKVAA